MLRNSGSVPVLPAELGRRGQNDAGASSIRSGGSARSKIPLSARSAASAISMHVNSYSYLSNRVYDFLQARSAWLRRTQYEREEGGDAALKVRGSSFAAPRFSGSGSFVRSTSSRGIYGGEQIPTAEYHSKHADYSLWCSPRASNRVLKLVFISCKYQTHNLYQTRGSKCPETWLGPVHFTTGLLSHLCGVQRTRE